MNFFLCNLTLEKAISNLGADIIIPFDELPPYHIDRHKLVASLHRTHRWEQRSLEEHLKSPNNQAMYSVIHGGIDPELRALSCKTLTNLPFDGHAIGGSLGKNHEQMFAMLTHTMPLLPPEKPNHLLGIGDITSLGPCIALGVDTFDSSHPTRCARHGLLFTFGGTVKIMRSTYRTDFGPIEAGCACYTCRNYSAAYIHHLFKAHELTAYTLASIHNLYFMMQLMGNYRQAILENRI